MTTFERFRQDAADCSLAELRPSPEPIPEVKELMDRYGLAYPALVTREEQERIAEGEAARDEERMFQEDLAASGYGWRNSRCDMLYDDLPW